MEFTVARSSFLRELDLAQGVAEKKTTIPILSNVLLESADGRLSLSATDLELGLRCGCQARIERAGASTVPGKRLLEIVRALPEADVKVKGLENHFIEITCQRSVFKLAGMAKDNFPSLPEVPKALATVPAGIVPSMIARTAFAIASEESRYTLNGALLLLKPDRVAMVATDGHRLAHVEREAQVEGLNGELRTLIPKKALGELQRLLAHGEEQAAIQFAKDDSHLFFTVSDRVLTSRVLTGQYPNYEAVLPRDNSRVMDLDKAQMTDAIRRVALLADERSRAVRLEFSSGKMEIFSSSGEFGEAHEVVDVDYSGEGMQIGFNYQYLLDFLAAVGEIKSVRLELKDEQSAGQLRPFDDSLGQYRYVVMPMRV
jgi:DNA polymerase III subunit beta